MATQKEIYSYLDNCTMSEASSGAKGTGLKAVHKKIFDSKSNIPKEKMLEELVPFYADAKKIIDIFNGLSECEKDFISYIVQYDGNEFLPTTIEFAKKYNIELEYEKEYYNGRKYTQKVLDDHNCKYNRLKFLYLLQLKVPKSKTVVFFPSGKDMPPFVLNALKTVVKPMEFDYDEYSPSKNDYVICRESRIGDFAALVRLASSEKLKVKPDTFDLTKAKLAKLSEVIGFEEVCDLDGKFCTPKEAKRINDYKVALPLFVLSANSVLLDIKGNGEVLPGAKSAQALGVGHGELAKSLFNQYVNSRDIHELRYITYISAYDGNHWINWPECRKPIINLLKTCLGEQFIHFEQFNKYAKIFCGNFFRKLLNCALMVKGYDFGYSRYGGGYEPEWDECEAQVIRLILSFLSALGMVDIAYTENVPRIQFDDNDFCVGIAGFRITKLGMWILGMADSYDESRASVAHSEEGKLVALPDYTVMISGLKCRIEHETYLSKFLTKVSTDENVAVYKIDFGSIVRAFDIGITPSKIKAYLKKASSTTLPENVGRSLDDWQAKVGRVRIRTVTILETDDALLLEELKAIKSMDTVVIEKIQNAVSIFDSQEKKAKTLIEKNGWLVSKK